MVFGSMRHAAQQLRHSARSTTTRRTVASTSSSFAVAPRATPAFVHARTNAAPLASMPQHVKADPTGVVAGIAIVGALIGVGKMWWDASSSGQAEPLAFQEIPQAELALFFTELTAAVKELLKQLPELEKAVRKYLQENNQELSDTQFKQAILQQLYKMMEDVEVQIVAKRQWSRQSVEFAMEKYAQDAEILKLQENLNDLMRSVFPVPEIPEDLTADKTLAILKEMVAGMEKAMSDMLAHARAEGITDARKAMDEFQHLYVEHVEQMAQAQMQTNGISQEIFTIALQKYHTESEQFRQQAEQIYAHQANAFKKMGLPVETQ